MHVETCDRCHVRAVWLWLTEDHELATCGHHGRQHGPALKAAGFEPYRLDVPDMRDVDAGAVTG